MSSPVEEQRADVRPDRGGVPARRAMARWAWRLFRREWRQQLLVLALITIAVMATILGAAIGTNTPPPGNETFGTAGYLATLPGSDPHLAADLKKITTRFSPAEVIENESLTTGSVNPIELRAQNPNGPYLRQRLALVSGHYPTGTSQVALTSQVAALYNVGIGDLWRGGGRSWRVVGMVEDPDNLLDQFALVAPGQLRSPSSVNVLFDASQAQVAAFSFPHDATYETPPPGASGISPAIVVLVLAIFGLLFVGLVAVAGFTVLAQRRLRALGMVSALGATDRHVRLVMVANGAVVGALATLVGAVIGFALWFAYAPHLQATAGHRIDQFDLPWWSIGTAMGLSVVTAVRAARRPARVVARIPVVLALSGRPANPRPAHRTAVPGVVLLGVGAYLLAYAGGWGGNTRSDLVHLLSGLVTIVLGTLFVGPPCLTALAALGRRAPIAVRLALRDLARYRTRSGAALSAISFTVLVAVFICVVAGARYSNAVDYFAPNLPSNQLVVYTPVGAAVAGLTQNLCAPTNEQMASGSELRRDQSTVNAIAASLNSKNVLTLDTASGPLLQTTNGGTDVGEPYVATPAVLAHYGISPSEISPVATLLTSRVGLAGTSALQLPFRCSSANSCPRSSCIANPSIQTVSSLPAYKSDPDLLLTAYAVHKLGLHLSTVAWLIQVPHALTAAEINSARQKAAAVGLTIETKNGNPSLAELDNWATTAAILLVLGVLAMTVGLVRSETAGDLRVLAATGAGSRIRRTITGATAGALGLLGAVVGTSVAYLAAVCYFRSQLGERLSHVPVLDLLLIIVGLPVAAAVGGFLLAGREPSAIAHQPLE